MGSSRLDSRKKWTKELRQTRNNRNTEILKTNHNSVFYLLINFLLNCYGEKESLAIILVSEATSRYSSLRV